MTLSNRLDSYIDAYVGFNDWLIERRYRHLRQCFRGRTCLELGIAKGAGIDVLLDTFEQLTVVDGSAKAVALAQQRYADRPFRAIHSAFEDLELGDQRFDTIVMAHILEHVDDPQTILRRVCAYLAPGGRIIIDVPNAHSIHRRVGVKMGLLEVCNQLNSADLSIGHQRVYCPDSFRQEVRDADLEILEFGGMFIKVTSGAQTDQVFNAEQLEAFFQVGVDLPELAAEIFIVATTA